MTTSTTYFPGGSMGVPERYGSYPLKSPPAGGLAVVVGLATHTVQLVPGMDAAVNPVVPGPVPPTPPVNVVFIFPVVGLMPSTLGKKYLPSYGAGCTWFQMCIAS